MVVILGQEEGAPGDFWGVGDALFFSLGADDIDLLNL